MKHGSLIFIILTLFVAVSPAYCMEAEQASRLEFYSRAVKDDYSRFYLDGGNLLRLGAVLGLSGVMANSAADREVREYYQEDIRDGATDTVASGARVAGDIFIMAPLLAATELYFDRSTPYGLWASRSLRAYAVGGPAGLLIQKTTGSGRPAEGDSQWYLAYASVCAVDNGSKKTLDEKSFLILPLEKKGIIAYFD